jgi:hypothetical protein
VRWRAAGASAAKLAKEVPAVRWDRLEGARQDQRQPNTRPEASATDSQQGVSDAPECVAFQLMLD